MVEKVATAVPLDQTASHLEWIKIKEELNETFNETAMQKLSRKSQMNPFVPIGCMATVGCLVFGLYNMKKGDQLMSQKMMRYRIGAQAFTVVAIMTSVVLGAMNMSKD